ncbi:MAG TPA: hypothetical protein VKG84_06940 [Candidatus Acidoferrales bacterium]|nr:hypothetical protein [Candidatus Acidoferrales bacterium]
MESRRATALRYRAFLCLALLAAAAAPFGAPATAQSARGATNGAVIMFRKVFKSSSPEFTEIHVPENGHGTCDQRSLDEEPDPQAMEISQALRGRIFALAGELHNFRGLSLDVKRRIANLGEKTFRYEKGGEVNEVKFNYTLNSKANQLLQIFEGLVREQEDLAVLQRRMKYDRLGVNEALVQLDDDVRHQAVAQPERFLPLLEQIAGDSKFLEIARQKARALVDTIRAGGH